MQKTPQSLQAYLINLGNSSIVSGVFLSQRTPLLAHCWSQKCMLPFLVHFDCICAFWGKFGLAYPCCAAALSFFYVLNFFCGQS